ncbi:alpha/beta hydrolase [Novosphingobium sp.]|uniref:alpha/beta hydrolase n=1 Tax=Novosphingobium sp. TaxID=1874826 RepID=UPI002B4679E8|nr:alpha/beta hydrolase [Novosphingobium sp.]HKR91531.1 alpha/beta hydrolase [Novosphingobium sp.]
MAPGAGETVVDGLAKAGIAASAVDLPGRGANKDRPICLSESLKVIDEAICALDGPVVLCGHSYGGVPISWAAMRNDRITEVVHLAAILPLEDEIMAGVVEATMERVGHRMRFEDGFSTVASFQDSVDMMYGDCSPEDARWAYDRLVPEPFNGMPEPGAAATTVPCDHAKVTYVVCKADSSMDADLQRRIATLTRYVVEWPTGHSLPWLSQPQICIDLLARIARAAVR